MRNYFIAVLMLFAVAPAVAGPMDAAECMSLTPGVNLGETLNNVNNRIAACFNHQQDLARDRDREYRDIIRRLEQRIQRLEKAN